MRFNVILAACPYGKEKIFRLDIIFQFPCEDRVYQSTETHTMFYHLQILLNEDDSDLLIFWFYFIGKNEGLNKNTKLFVF